MIQRTLRIRVHYKGGEGGFHELNVHIRCHGSGKKYKEIHIKKTDRIKFVKFVFRLQLYHKFLHLQISFSSFTCPSPLQKEYSSRRWSLVRNRTEIQLKILLFIRPSFFLSSPDLATPRKDLLRCLSVNESRNIMCFST